MKYKFSKRSLEVLGTVEMELRVLMKESLKVSEVDFAVVEGYRTDARQAELYRRGRDGKGGKIVTYKDGVYTRSKHQDKKAVDIGVWKNGKIDWDDVESYEYLAGVILQKAKELGIKVKAGISWKMRDLPHYELTK